MLAITDTSERARRAAASIAAQFGLAFETANIIGGHSNTMVELRPLPLVARVATGTGTIRSGSAWLERELAVAAFLAGKGADVPRPSALLPPGPHSQGGMALTFWQLVSTSAEPADPHAAGAALRRCHEALEAYRGDLPRMAPYEESRRLVDHPRIRSAYAPEHLQILRSAAARIDAELARTPMRCRPLHGDAHAGNAWPTGDGLLWGDWEDTCTGPVEWDLACLVASSRVLGDGSDAAAALAGYAQPFDEGMLDWMIEARTLQAVLWSAINRREPGIDARALARLRWLEGAAVVLPLERGR